MMDNNQINIQIQAGEIKKKDEVKDIDVFNELKRRVDLTRRARIKASTRLRSNHEFYEMITNFYSVIILILSVWVIGTADDETNTTTKMLLISSLVLTFSTMYLGIKNYKERASSFEFNYQQLNVLLNKMQRLEAQPDNINQRMLKELHRDYEKLIIEKENHLPIDYMMCNEQNELKYKDAIKRYNQTEKLKKIVISIVPLAVIIIYFIYF